MFGASAVVAVGAGMAIGSAMSADAPDTSGMNDAARQQAALSKEELDWYKQIYEETRPQRAESTRIAQEQAQLQTDAARKAMGEADAASARYKGTFQPVENKIVADAMGYDTPQRREAAAAAAGADVSMSAAAQRQASLRSMERSGALPSSGRVAALQGAFDIGTAKASVGAQNTARQQVETVGSAKLMDAAGLGKGVVTNQATQAQIGLNASRAGVASGAVPVDVANSGASMMGQGFQLGNQSLANAANTYGQIAGINQKANDSNNQMMSGLGSAAGMAAAAYFSDEDMKEDISPASDDAALDALRKTPVKEWRYRADSPAADGGQMHVGPMAQKVAATMGMDAAPGGKMIDPVTMNGVTMGAVRALDKKVQKIAAAMGMDVGEPAAA